MRISALVLTGLAVASIGFGADNAVVWLNSELKSSSAKLKPKINDQHYALERLGDFDSHYVLMVYREGNGPAETHDAQTDFYVVQEGSATLHLGGEVVDGKEIEPGEVRGKSIKGGRTVKLRKGDTVNIPPKTPHQIVLDKGETITYLIVKVHAR